MKYLSIIISLLVLILSSCTSCDDCCEIIDTTLVIEYQDLEGNCLIDDPKFDQNGIQIFYLEDMEFEIVNIGRLSNPKGYRVDSETAGCSNITVFLSPFYTGNTSTTLIKLPMSVPDTIVAQFNLSDGNEILESFELNGVTYTERAIIIRK